ncbi:MAG: SURF1 family protein [Aeromicrobium erythreum]
MSTTRTGRRPGYGFLLSRRWLGFAVFVLVLAAVCTRLGFWQLHKLYDRFDRNAIIEKHLKADAVPLDEALPRDASVDQRSEWTRVRLTGTFDSARTVTVKFATRDGAPGVDVVTPLRLADGSGMLVDRGWMETDNTNRRPTNLPQLPSGQVTVTGWLRQDNGAGDDAVKPTDGQVRAIASRGLAGTVDYPLRKGYVDLLKQSPAAAGDLQAEPEPELGQGPHFFYALQWWFFALLAVVGYFWFARAERKERVEAWQKGDATASPDDAEQPSAVTPG